MTQKSQTENINGTRTKKNVRFNQPKHCIFQMRALAAVATNSELYAHQNTNIVLVRFTYLLPMLFFHRKNGHKYGTNSDNDQIKWTWNEFDHGQTIAIVWMVDVFRLTISMLHRTSCTVYGVRCTGNIKIGYLTGESRFKVLKLLFVTRNATSYN